MDLDQHFYRYTHGGYALLIIYVLVGAGVLAGLIRSRVSAVLYVAWPFVTVPTVLVAGIADWLIESLLAGPMHLRLADWPDAVLTFSVFIGIGFVGGLYWAGRGAGRDPGIVGAQWYMTRGVGLRTAGVPCGTHSH